MDDKAKEKIHTSGLPKPAASQQPHHPPTIQQIIQEKPNDANVNPVEQDFENEPEIDPIDKQVYERKS
jgi:hypothetical protein